MIFKNNKELSTIYLGEKPLVAIYKGARMIWQAVRSCFGRGYWIGSKPWIGTDKWKSINK